MIENMILIVCILMENYMFEHFINNIAINQTKVEETSTDMNERYSFDQEESIRHYVTESFIDEDTIQFLNELSQEIYKDNSSNLDLNDKQLLSIKDIEHQPVDLDTSSVLHSRLELPITKISDHLIGRQVWNVKVIGFEQDYIHVYDGSRTWIHCNTPINCMNNDILNLVVDRTGTRVKLVECRDIHRVSDEYLIPDEYLQAV